MLFHKLVMFVLSLIVLFSSSCAYADFLTLADKDRWKVMTESQQSHAPPFTSIYFFDENHGVATSPTKIRTTCDGGTTWDTSKQDDDIVFLSVSFRGGEIGWVLGVRDKHLVLMRSSDKGRTWDEMSLEQTTREIANRNVGIPTDFCSNDDDSLWIGGDQGIIRLNIHGDEVSVNVSSTDQKNIRSIACQNSGSLWAVSDDLIIKYDNGWNTAYEDLDFLPAKIRIQDETVWVVGGKPNDSGAVVIKGSANGGNWKEKSFSFPGAALDIYTLNNIGWLVGAGGSILHTVDNGESWQSVSSPSTNDLMAIYFIKPGLGWIAGDRSTILKLSH